MTARDLSGPASLLQSGPVEQRVLILAPMGNDARLTQRFLGDAGIHSEIVQSISGLCAGIEEGCGTLLLAEETLAADTVEPLLKTISQQPSWSDIPLVLITSGGETSQTRLRRLTTLGPVGNVTMLERPFRPVTLLSAIETALRARGKQYQVRDLLKEIQTSERQVQSVLASIADGFVAVDKNWRFTYLNAAYLKLIAPLYPSADALLGENLWEKFPDLLGTDVEEQYRKAMTGQKPASFELFYAPISTWLEMRVYPAPDALSIYVRDINDRKTQEESLEALTRQVSAQAKTFDTTLSNITDFAYILNREGQFLYANKPLLDLWGLQLHEAKGKNFFDLKYPAPLAGRLQQEIEHVFTTREIVRGETPYTNPEGKEGYYEYIFSPVLAPDGTVEVVAGSTRVITERKRAEALGERRRLVLQLIAEDAPLEKIFESLAHMVELEAQFNVRVGIQLTDTSQILSAGSPTPQAKAIDRTDKRMNAPPDRAGLASDAEGSPLKANAHVDISSDLRWTEMREEAQALGLEGCWAALISSGHGQELGTFAIFHAKSHELSSGDKRLITTAINTAAVAIERKRAQQALRASEAQLRLVTDHAPVYLVQCDRDHRYKFVNRAYALRFAREPQALLGVRVADIMGAKAYAEVRSYMDAALAGERVEFEHEIAFGGNAPRWMHTVYIPEYAKDGGVIGFVGVINDVTSRKQSELELMSARDRALEAARAKDDFLAALSHELRTPLNPVLLIASEAANDPDLPEKVREDFETIARNATLEARLIDDLLDLTRITHGKMSLDKRTIDLHVVLADALETVSPELREKKQALNVKLAAANCHIFGDPARVQQIFWNVLKNAVKFTPPGGAITVETRCDKNLWCAVRIQDSGIGMSDDEVGRVFDAFSQGNHAHGAGSHRFGGLGLGLAISRMLVDLHSGKISASSKGKNLGSTFIIEFPLVAAEVDFSRAPAPHRASRTRLGETPFPSGKSRRILVVEDHVATRLSLTRLLARRGYDITEAGTVAEALQRAEETAFDLVVSDIGLPDGDGYSLMERLRGEHGLKGVALSGYGMEQDIARGREAGFTDHLIKPVNVDSLDRVLRAWEEALS